MSERPDGFLLRMRNIEVEYDQVQALKGVDFDLRPGEIHAIVGEHRAGKSTLMRVLTGTVPKAAGEIEFKGRPCFAFDERKAISRDISMFYQSLNVIPSLNTVQNIYLSRIQKKYGFFVDYRAMTQRVDGFMRRLGIDFDISTPLMNLPIDIQNMVELIKVFLFEPDIIILDEISSRLTPGEMERVYPYIVDQKSKGKSTIYITHYMNEVFQFADRVTILKNGVSLGTEAIENLDNLTLYRMTYSSVLTREELQRDNIKLYHLKMYNEQIIKNLPIGVIILDPSNAVYLINDSAERLFGPATDATGIAFSSILEKVDDETGNDILEKMRRLLEWTWDEVQFEGKHIRIKYFPFRDSFHDTMGNILLFEDISKDISFKEYYIRTQKISSIAELAAGIAHEINNPLGIIKNYITLLRLEGKDEEARPLITKISNEIERINDIIGSLLSFSKMRSSRGKAFDIQVAIKETLVLLGHALREKGITLTSHTAEDPALVMGDENRIRQVFFNLIMNSIEAVSERGRIEIYLRVRREDRVVEVGIKDDGVGINDEIKDMVFEPFFSNKEGKSNTGLGLTICQHIVQAHNGVIYFTSVPGKETIFTVALPMA
jgi:two-component system, NtrC family, sensor histidine kinase AtoS